MKFVPYMESFSGTFILSLYKMITLYKPYILEYNMLTEEL